MPILCGSVLLYYRHAVCLEVILVHFSAPFVFLIQPRLSLNVNKKGKKRKK